MRIVCEHAIIECSYEETGIINNIGVIICNKCTEYWKNCYVLNMPVLIYIFLNPFSSPLGPIIRLRILLSNEFSLHSFLKMLDNQYFSRYSRLDLTRSSLVIRNYMPDTLNCFLHYVKMLLYATTTVCLWLSDDGTICNIRKNT